MILIICAMKEERDAFMKYLEDPRIEEGRKLFYHGEEVRFDYHVGKIHGKEVVLVLSGVGDTYATIGTLIAVDRFHPELVLNVGCAGSLNEDIHVGDTVVADRTAYWRFDVPDWDRGMNAPNTSFDCSARIAQIVREEFPDVKCGPIVSADEFIYEPSQVEVIRRFFPEALCGEMEGCAIANTCYALGVECSIIRSITDETLVNGDYKNFDFNLEIACINAAKLCVELIKRS